VKVLVLGGTRFLGRHIVEALAARGHEVVAFHRGETRCELPDGVEERFGDRNSDLSAVQEETWDATVDVAAYEPDQVRRALELRTARYLFISTVNVYEDLSKPGISEEWPTIESFDPSEESLIYGGKKAACERLVLERFPESSIILRPGLIVGRWDPTGRFTYWCERMLRGGPYLAPKPQARPVQLVDAADVAHFAERALTHDLFGTYNVVGPRDAITFAEVLDQCARAAARRHAPPAEAVWVDGEFLAHNGVQEWIEMPLWLADPKYAGILQASNAAAIRTGFELRPLGETVDAILEWTAAEPGGHRVAGLSEEREHELLAKLRDAPGACAPPTR